MDAGSMQLAQASTFAAYLGTVVETDVPKPTDVLRLRHGLIPRSVQQRDNAPSTVDANPLAILDLRGGIAGAHHGRQAVLARDDGCVAHGAADVGHGGTNFLKDGCPGWIRDMADENIPLLQTRDYFHRLHDACDPFHYP